jgi:hypothetical protein
MAFNSLKNSQIVEPISNYPRKYRPYSLIVDASTGSSETNGGWSAMLCQTNEDGEEILITMDHFDTY